MEHAATAGIPGPGSPGLAIALALLAGLVAQATAHHLRIPGIVLLLATGALLGPDAMNIIHPDAVRFALPHLVSFAVAVILFEGGLNLEIRRLRRASGVIQRLITVGSAVTLVGATLAARLLLDWPRWADGPSAEARSRAARPSPTGRRMPPAHAVFVKPG